MSLRRLQAKFIVEIRWSELACQMAASAAKSSFGLNEINNLQIFGGQNKLAATTIKPAPYRALQADPPAATARLHTAPFL